MVLRRPLGSWLPLLLVLALELVNEAFNFTRYYVDGYHWELGPMLFDITILPPLAIVMAARWETAGNGGMAATSGLDPRP